mgnify:CR=1 FL=1
MGQLNITQERLTKEALAHIPQTEPKFNAPSFCSNPSFPTTRSSFNIDVANPSKNVDIEQFVDDIDCSRL